MLPTAMKRLISFALFMTILLIAVIARNVGAQSLEPKVHARHHSGHKL